MNYKWKKIFTKEIELAYFKELCIIAPKILLI